MKVIINIIGIMLLTAFTGDNANEQKNNCDMTPPQEPLFTFGIIADVQYCDCETYNSRFYRNSLTKLNDAVSSISEYSPEFIINLGDLIDRDYNSFRPVLEIFEKSNTTVYHCLGNHDFSVPTRDIRKVVRLTDTRDGYYSFKNRNFRFIVLNGNEIATYAATSGQRKQGSKLLEELSNSGAVNAYSWNGGISNEQLEWLENELNESLLENEKVFLICHFPVFPEGTHNMLNGTIVLNTIAKYDNIVSWFNGHNHDGAYGNFNMIHFVTFKGMVETDESNAYAVVEVYPNKIWIKGSGREKSQILAY